MPPGHLRLYVTGSTMLSERATTNVHALLSGELAGQYELEIVDVLEHPEAAEEGRIVVTPTLVRRRPEPVRHLVGDLSDRTVVLASLQLAHVASGADKEPAA